MTKKAKPQPPISKKELKQRASKVSQSSYSTPTEARQEESVKVDNADESTFASILKYLSIIGAVYFIITKPAVDLSCLTGPDSAKPIDKLIFVGRYIAISVLALVFVTISGRLGNRTTDPARNEEVGAIITGNVLLRKTLTHVIIFLGCFLGKTLNGADLVRELQLFTAGLFLYQFFYVAGSKGILRGAQYFGLTIVFSTQLFTLLA